MQSEIELNQDLRCAGALPAVPSEALIQVQLADVDPEVASELRKYADGGSREQFAPGWAAGWCAGSPPGGGQVGRDDRSRS